MKPQLKRPILVFLCCLLVTGTAIGQEKGLTPVSQSNSIPPTVQWFFFLSAVDHMDHAADKLQAQGKESAWLRDSQQNKLHFTDQQFQLVREAAQRIMAEVSVVNSQADLARVIFRQSHPLASADSADIGSYRSQMASLSQQRKTVLESEISKLRAALGPETSSALDTYIRTQVGSHIAVSHRGAFVTNFIPDTEVTR